MTESETPSRIRLNRSMLGRLAAVGLFLGLGTLAVMHTVTTRKQTNGDTNDAAVEKTAASGDKPTDPAAATSSDSPLVQQIGSDTAAPILSTSNPKSLATGRDSSPDKPNSLLGGASSAPPSAGPMIPSPFPKAISKSDSITAPPIMAGANRSEKSDGVPSLNVSGTNGLPPPTMSFSNSASKAPESNDLRAANSSPIVSTQIQVETGDDSNADLEGESTPSTPTAKADLPSLSIPNSATNSPLIKSLTPNAGDSPTAGNNSRAPMRLSDDSPSSNGRPTDTATPYDSPSLNASLRNLNSQSEAANSNASPSVSLGASKVLSSNTKSSFGSSANDTFNKSTPQNPPALNGSFPSQPPTKSTSENPPIRSSSPPILNSSNSAGTSSDLQPRGSFNASSRSFDSGNSTPSENLRVQATPGAANLEGPQVPTLKLQKIAPREVQINKPSELQLVVQNSGQVPAEQVIVYDRVPDGTQLIDAVPKANQAADGTLSWNLGTIAPGETSKITINLLPVRPGEFGSVAQVTFAAQASARTLCTQPILEVKQTTKPKVLVGDEVVLDITIENKGDGPATNVMLQENVPDLLTFDDGSRELEFEVGTLAPNQKRNVQLRLKAAKVGLAQNRIVAQGDADLQATDVVDLEVIAPELHATGEGPDRKYVNRSATHQFALTNAGTANATNVDLVARLPRGLKFVSANNHGQYDASSNAVYWSLQQLAAGQTGRVELVTLPMEPGEQKIDFEATADLNQKTSVSKSLSVDALVELFCDIDDLTDPIEIGGETAYRVKVVNQGLQAATNVRLHVDFPAGIQPISVSGSIPNQIQGQRVVFSAIDRLDPQQETVVTVTAKGTVEGDHRVVVGMASDARETQIAKEESTQVYSDRR